MPRPPAPRCGRQRPRREDGEAGGGGGGHERWTSAGACGPQEPLARLAALFFYPQEAAAGSLQESRGVWANSTSARCNWTHHRPNPSRSKRPSPSRSPSEARDSPPGLLVVPAADFETRPLQPRRRQSKMLLRSGLATAFVPGPRRRSSGSSRAFDEAAARPRLLKRKSSGEVDTAPIRRVRKSPPAHVVLELFV